MEKDIDQFEKNGKQEDDKIETSEQVQDMENELKQMLFKNTTMKKGEQVKDSYKFWDTQPVPKMHSEDSKDVGPIETDNHVDKERKEPYKLPSGFSWYDIEINDDKELTMVNH
jgi:hypothetical protein